MQQEADPKSDRNSDGHAYEHHDQKTEQGPHVSLLVSLA
jgi:hypothetical protein